MTIDEQVARKLGWPPMRWRLSCHNAIMSVSSENVRDQHLAMGWKVIETIWPPVSTDWAWAGKALEAVRQQGIEITLVAAEPGYWATGTRHPEWTTPYCHGRESGPLAIALAINAALAAAGAGE